MKREGRGLECTACGGSILAVKDSRPSFSSVRRRRKCLGCGHRMTTYEIFSVLDDERNLGAALQLWDKIRSLPELQRNALLALINASAVLSQPLPTFAPPMIIENKPPES